MVLLQLVAQEPVRLILHLRVMLVMLTVLLRLP